MPDFFLTLGAKVVIGLARIAWQTFWQLVREAVAFAERKWRAQGEGARKLEFVLARVEEWLTERGVGGWRKQLVLRVVERQIAKAIAQANEELGHDWIEHVDTAERYLTRFFPWAK